MPDAAIYDGNDTDNYPIGQKLTLRPKRLEVIEVTISHGATLYWCKNLDDPTERPSPYLSSELDIA